VGFFEPRWAPAQKSVRMIGDSISTALLENDFGSARPYSLVSWVKVFACLALASIEDAKFEFQVSRTIIVVVASWGVVASQSAKAGLPRFFPEPWWAQS
jgi:hypothetical protein